MYLDKWIILILIYVIGLIGYTIGEDSGFTKGWIARSEKDKYFTEED